MCIMDNMRMTNYYGVVTPVFSCPPDNTCFRQVILSDGVQVKYRAFVEMAMAFDEAVAKCEEVGAILMEIITLEKFNFVKELMTCPGFVTTHFWLSGVYNNERQRWETIRGLPLPMSSTFWATNMPDGSGKCTWMSHRFDLKWDDGNCTKVSELYPTFALCEIP